MKRVILLILLLILVSSQNMLGYYSAKKFFSHTHKPLSGHKIVTDIPTLLDAAEETVQYLRTVHKSKYVTVDAGLLSEYGVTIDDVRETLEFIVATGKKRPELLKSSWFLNQNFSFYRWYGDKEKKPKHVPRGWKGPPEHIRITKYRITETPGSLVKTKKYNYPLYMHPSDEKNFTIEQQLKNKKTLTRYKYSRSQILNGVLHNNKYTKPLAWVTEKGYEDLAMQGTVVVILEKGKRITFSITGNNRLLDDKKYWYVEKKQKIKSKNLPIKVHPHAGVTYAADIKLLGFGKIILLIGKNGITKKNEMRLGVLVDTGSAFRNNLSKIDIFTGFFSDEKNFKAHAASYPHTARAYILIKKKKH